MSHWILFREVFWEPRSSKVYFLNFVIGGFLPLILGVSGKGWGGSFSVGDLIDLSLLLRHLKFSFTLA